MTFLTDTTSAHTARELERMRADAGSGALGKVLNLIAVVKDEEGVRAVSESALDVAQAHPLRIIILLPDADSDDATPRLDAEIKRGDSVGVAEVVILRPYNGAGENQVSLVLPLLIPDAPVFTWWVQEAPKNPSATGLGKVSTRRITNANATRNPVASLTALAQNRQPGDTDLTWAGITIWRSQLAALLNEAPHEAVTSAEVYGNTNRAGANLLAGWLALRLGVSVHLEHCDSAGIESVYMHRESGALSISRPHDGDIATLSRPGRADLQIAMPMRSLQAQLIEELRTVNDDLEFSEVIQEGLPLVN
ncbi:glucose-6-phosphate dehydrogenase assembly protein OpcA [Trueperella bonasi]|uniref:Glucose-6-phosphate dehydrogenase assembly protein OpcA n=1 Tax=Trueperella bonasi TaxID=312286 RepID=A0ABT9NDS5_9ACTO|nr:glucose-6-phosphate dehydrogenase assembly protein OpcA [Trueperella bonasi]MDP9805484.1 glucose-6-phosphate dehydrogenase assembly protein OpcA [Trueperella bonasi]